MIQRQKANTALATALCGLVLLAVHPASRFYPACPIYEHFHLLCPGCGATRALAALLRADLTTAWHMNSLFVCALPFALFFAARAYRRRAPPPLSGPFV
jgi:hypothetical protein